MFSPDQSGIRLYNEAQRRVDKRHEMEKNLTKQANNLAKQAEQFPSVKQSEIFLANRIIKEFNAVISQISELDGKSSMYLDYLE